MSASQQSDMPFVGNRAALAQLSAALRSGRIPHAYLFTGPPHVGKTTLATWLAQALLCEQSDRRSADPCGTCRVCVRISHGSHTDVQAYGLARQAQTTDKAAASRELGIDAVREIVREIDLLPFEGQRKVYIIEDAGTLTEEAANGLLKTLEEPPSFATLILLAEDESALPDTVRSRSTTVRLGPVSDGEVLRLLLSQPGSDPRISERIARLAVGRPGWALGALREPKVLESHDAHVAALLDALSGGAAARLALAEKMAKRWGAGHRQEVYDTLLDWLGYLRGVMYVSAGVGNAAAYPDQHERTRTLASRGVEAAGAAAKRTVQALAHLDANVNTRMAIEDLLLDFP